MMKRPTPGGLWKPHWIAASVFAVVGALVTFVVAPLLAAQADPDTPTPIGSVRALGWAFLIISGTMLLMLAITREIERTGSQNAHVWEWWINFVGGMLGAALFGVPATLVLPFFFLAYIDRPNRLFPDPDGSFWSIGALGLLFTSVGLVTLVALYAMSRAMLRSRPRWKRHGFEGG